MYPHVRNWTDPDGYGFELDLFDTLQTDRYGKSILNYWFTHQGRLIFEGADFHCSPLHPLDSDKTVADVLAFLSIKPGDTDPEYFRDYPPKQLEWVSQWGETLSWYVEELEGGRK